MAGAAEHVSESAIEIIPIHFDVPAHQIPLSTFIRTARQTEAVIHSFNRELFEGKLKYEILVLPPEEGTFLSRLGLAILAGWGCIWSFTESDIGQAFIKGLTTHEPAYWAEMAGTGVRKQLLGPAQGAEPESEAGGEAAERKYETRIVVETTKSFLQKDAAALESAGVTPRRFRDAYHARNEFYQACTETTGLRAVGFDEAAVFPVPRSDFARLQVALPPPDDDEEPWLTGIVILKVTSPNWDRDDRQRQWKGKDGQGHERYFRIDDEYFWSLVKADRLNTHIIDTIKVQWAFRGKAESPRNCRVLKVLEFNGAVLSDPLDDNGLKSILGVYDPVSSDQGDLFEP